MSSHRDRAVGAAMLITTSTYITYAIGLLTGAIVARALGPTEYGRYAFCVWLTGWLVMVGNHGLTTTGIRFVAQALGQSSRELARRTHAILSRWQIVSSVLVVIVFVIASAVFDPADWRDSMMLFVGTVALASYCRASYLFDISIAKGHSRFDVEAWSTLTVSFLTLLGSAALATLHARVEAFVLLFAFSSVAMWAMSRWQLFRADIRPASRPPDAPWVTGIRRHLAWTTLLIAAMTLGNRSIETFALNFIGDSTDVGFFTLAGGLAKGSVDLLTVGLSTLLMPMMGRAYGAHGDAGVRSIFSTAMRYFAFMGLMLAGIGVFWSAPVIALFYGREFEPVASALAVFQIVGGLTISEAAFGSLLATTGQQSAWAKASCLAIPVSLVGSVLLVPQYGLQGALLSAVTARAATFLMVAFTVLRLQKVVLPFGALVRLLASAMLCLAAAYPVTLLPGAASAWLAGATFIVLMPVATLLAGAWNTSDLELVRSLFARLPAADRLDRLASRFSPLFRGD